jgi:hypothetical protein
LRVALSACGGWLEASIATRAAVGTLADYASAAGHDDAARVLRRLASAITVAIRRPLTTRE